MNKKNTLSLVLMSLTILLALVSFYSIFRAIKVPESSTWIVPIVWVSLFVVTLCTSTIFLRSRLEAEMVIAVSFLLSLPFAFNIWHFAFLVVSIFLMLGALRSIRNDLDLNVKVNLWKSLSTGKFKMILAIVLVVCSQYYFTIKTMNGNIKAPKLDFSSVSQKLVGPVLGMINPNFQKASVEDLTVDQFIIRSQEQNAASQDQQSTNDLDQEVIETNIPQSIPAQQRAALVAAAKNDMAGAKQKLLLDNQDLVLKEGRRQLSEMAGKQLSGDEKISLVFSGMINDKINSYFDPNIKGDQRSPLFSFIMTMILFLTIWPMGSFLCIFWFWVVIVLFKIFSRFGLVEIKRIMVEREMIV